MNLAIFDIDGTLTATSKVDSDCYVQAFKEEFRLEIEDGDWSRFKNYTDSGIMVEIFQDEFGREPTPEEHQAVQLTFLKLLTRAFETSPDLFKEISGACTMLSRLRREKEWGIALATGCWRVSAEFKLDKAGFERAAIPISTCDQNVAREAIMLNALTLAKEAYEVSDFETIVYIGDGIWDMRASRKLRFGFIGVQHETYHKTALTEGAGHVIDDYRDYAAFLRLLSQARVPKERGA
ncbi:MAG: HAD family hydrolase [bacterium]